MNPIQVMETEHRLIETVVKSLGGAAARLETKQPVDVSALEKAAEFLRVYADKLHHGKEEALFFPILIKRGVPPQGCPITGLNHEHEKGRALVRALAKQLLAYKQNQLSVSEVLLQTLRDLGDLYQNHIWKEDAMVFPMADKLLTEADRKELAEEFAKVDRAIGLETIARLESFARDVTLPADAPLPNAAPPCGCSCERGL
jgi:hemerythrin-like domain-containing protein